MDHPHSYVTYWLYDLWYPTRSSTYTKARRRRDGRIDSETAFERHRSRIPINVVNTVLALKKRLTPRIAMKEFVEKYRPFRQRTVWEETTMDKARASPPAIYMKQLLAGLANGFNSGDQPVGAQQRQRNRSSYFGKWECDRCHICWRLYRWSGSYWGANRCRRIWHGLRKRLFWPKENEDITPITVSRSGWAIFAQFRLDF